MYHVDTGIYSIYSVYPRPDVHESFLDVPVPKRIDCTKRYAKRDDVQD